MSDTTTTPIPLNVRHAQLVTTARINANLSQSALAKAARTSQQTISRIENGGQGVSDGLKVRISAALRMKVSELFPMDDIDIEGDEE